ncbi:MAG: sulfide/dihydroorotate dehydrogenase-like FAD/NAD-binding protein [Chitinispirillales bacterium]|jgi:ferredoxin--NADP+ reductase|nr:sulfide/dihydroorotate dehydrogenase-like FAD/NAD-binding protein [Chitinispirillales bacterium]
MAEILKKERLSDTVYRFRLYAPAIAKKRKAGQFIILRPLDNSERIPLTIANADALAGWIEIIFQAVGKTTMQLSELREGESVLDLAGPLGKPTHIENFGRVLCIGGGVGAAPLFPIISALFTAGNDVTSIIGARSSGLIIMKDDIAASSSRLFIATDDGSLGTKGFVSDVFKSLVESGERFDAAFVIGPPMMMKATCGLTVSSGIKTYASLNPIMIDGTGMCGGCRVTVGGQTRFACVDGPEFDASQIEWDEMIMRLNSYKQFEAAARESHTCRLERVS